MSIKNIKKTSNLGSSAKKTQLYIVCHLENYLEIFSCNSHFTELGLRHCDKRQRDNVLCISITWHAKGSPLGVATYNDFCSNVFRIRIHFVWGSESAFILSQDPNHIHFVWGSESAFILSEALNPHSFCFRIRIRIHFVWGSESHSFCLRIRIQINLTDD